MSRKVIGERIVTPLSIVYLVVKLRITPPASSSPVKSEKPDSASDKGNDEEFLTSRKDAEDMPKGATAATRNDVELVVRNLPEPIDLDFDDEEGVLYWTDRGELPLARRSDCSTLQGL